MIRFSLAERKEAERYLDNLMVFDFSARELACKHCGECLFDDHSLRCLQAYRNRQDSPVIITSGYRCAVHNRNVGGARHSLHLVGQAFDLTMPMDRQTRSQAILMAGASGFRGLGLYDNFIHVDTRRDYTVWEQYSSADV